MKAFYGKNTIVVNVADLRNDDGNLILGATVYVALTDRKGVAVAEVPTPITCTELGSGEYEATIPALNSVLGSVIKLEVTTNVSGLDGHWTEYVYISERPLQ